MYNRPNNNEECFIIIKRPCQRREEHCNFPPEIRFENNERDFDDYKENDYYDWNNQNDRKHNDFDRCRCNCHNSCQKCNRCHDCNHNRPQNRCCFNFFRCW